MQYQCALLQANYDPYSKSLAEYSQYIEHLEASNLIGKTLKDLEEGGNKSHGEGKRKHNKGENAMDTSSTFNAKKTSCSTCGKFHKGACWKDPKNAHLRPNKKPKTGEHKKAGEIMISERQFNYLVSRLNVNNPIRSIRSSLSNWKSKVTKKVRLLI